MSTRSSITVQIGDKVKSIYCHFDGYPGNNGNILLNNYNSQDKAESLVCMGDMSALYPTIKESKFYCRDYGEDIHIGEYNSRYEAMLSNKQAYNYYWDGENWWVDKFKLTQELIDADV